MSDLGNIPLIPRQEWARQLEYAEGRKRMLGFLASIGRPKEAPHMIPECYSHPEYQQFVKSMRVDQSDAARLVCADWLQEQGQDQRAEFIRDAAAGIFMGLAHGNLPGQKWPLYRISDCVDKWFSTKSAPATLSMRLENRIAWRGSYGIPMATEAASAQLLCGFLHTITAPVHFVLSCLDELHSREPFHFVTVTDWDSQGPDGEPIIRRSGSGWTDGMGGLSSFPFSIYKVAGKHIQVNDRELDEVVGHGPGREGTLAMFMFRLRWPGVTFMVNI